MGAEAVDDFVEVGGVAHRAFLVAARWVQVVCHATYGVPKNADQAAHCINTAPKSGT
jgi:hypothetical protein